MLEKNKFENVLHAHTGPVRTRLSAEKCIYIFDLFPCV